MSKDIVFRIRGDVRELLRATDAAARSQDNLQKEFSDTARAAESAERRMTQSSARAARGAARSAATATTAGAAARGARALGPYDLAPVASTAELRNAVRSQGTASRGSGSAYGMRAAGRSAAPVSVADAFAASHSVALSRSRGLQPYGLGDSIASQRAANRAAIAALGRQASQPLDFRSLMPAMALSHGDVGDGAGAMRGGGGGGAKAAYVGSLRSAWGDLSSGKIGLEEYNRSIERARQKLVGATKAQQAFVSSGIGLGSLTAGYVSLASAIALGKGVLDDARQMQDEAAKSVVDEDSGRRALRQIAGDQSHYNAMISAAENLRSRSGFDAPTAYQTVFQAEQAGVSDKVDAIARLREIGVDPSAVMRGMGIFRTNFGEGAGSAEQMINKMIAAAGYSPTLEVHNIASEYSKAAALWKGMAAPGDDEGGLAATAVLSAGVENAGELMKSLAAQVGRKRGRIKTAGTEFEGMAGLDLLFALPELEKRGLLQSASGGTQTVDQFLEDVNARAGLSLILEKQEDIRRVYGDINRAQAETGTGADLFQGKLGFVDPKSAGARLQQEMEGRRMVAAEDRFALSSNLVDALYKYNVSQMTSEGYSGAAIGAWKSGASLMRFLNADDKVLRMISSDSFQAQNREGYGLGWNVPMDLRPAVEAMNAGDAGAAAALLGARNTLLNDDGTLSDRDQGLIARAGARYRNLRADGEFTDADLAELNQVIMDSAKLLKEAAQELKQGAEARRIADGGRPRAPRPSAPADASGPLRTPGGALIY